MVGGDTLRVTEVGVEGLVDGVATVLGGELLSVVAGDSFVTD